MGIDYYAHHGPVGAYASFTVGRIGKGGGLALGEPVCPDRRSAVPRHTDTPVATSPCPPQEMRDCPVFPPAFPRFSVIRGRLRVARKFCQTLGMWDVLEACNSAIQALTPQRNRP